MRFARVVVPATVGGLVVVGLGAPAHAADAPPTGAITAPSINDQVYPVKALTISGTAADDIGVASIGIAFQDRVTRLWLRPDGTFGAYYRFPVTFANAGAKSVSWKYTWTPPVTGAYLVQVVPKDTGGHAPTSLPYRRFYVDDRAPDTKITKPTSNPTIKKGASVTFTGTATDNFAVAYLQVAIQNKSTKKWLRPGGAWGAFYAFHKPVDHSGAASTPWVFKYGFGSTGSFHVQFAAVDAAGDVDPTPATRDVTVKK